MCVVPRIYPHAIPARHARRRAVSVRVGKFTGESGGMDERPAISRRGLLLGLVSSMASTMSSTVVAAPVLAYTRGEHRVLHLYNNWTRERFDDAFWSNGRFHPAALERFS